jgi:hypothetical protein
MKCDNKYDLTGCLIFSEVHGILLYYFSILHLPANEMFTVITTILCTYIGTHEVQECLEGQGEAELHQHQTNCKKNPGHEEFVPVNKFSLEHFPPGYHDNDLYDFIKIVADLTVRIAVNITSLDRPELIPGTKDPYPCYNIRSKQESNEDRDREEV